MHPHIRKNPTCIFSIIDLGYAELREERKIVHFSALYITIECFMMHYNANISMLNSSNAKLCVDYAPIVHKFWQIFNKFYMRKNYV